MVTMEEAQRLVFTRMKARQDAVEFSIVTDNTIERPFGWVFFVIIRYSRATAATDASRRLIIFNKHVDQVIESSIEYTPERLIEIYETLLAKSQRIGKHWCLTMSCPPMWPSFARARLAKKAKKLGLTEIS